MSEAPLLVYLETSPKKTFACAVDWPGWCRAGKDDGLALDALAAYAPRFAKVAKEAGIGFRSVDVGDLEVVDRVEGGSGTAFGVPSAIVGADRMSVGAEEAARQAALVSAAWSVFEAVASTAPAELRKGPRGGGRDRDKMIGHVVEADWYYAREIGVKRRQPAPEARAEVEALRAAVLDVLRQPSDGSPLAGRKWTTRYAARRIAWHALDHAWEIEDRSERGG